MEATPFKSSSRPYVTVITMANRFMFKSIVQERSTCVSGQSRAVWEVKLSLIPSRRIALKWGQDPHRVLLAIYQLQCGTWCLDSFYKSHFLSAFSLWMCLTFFSPIMYLHALGLFFLLRSTAERNQFSRSWLYNAFSSPWNTFLKIGFEFDPHMLK